MYLRLLGESLRRGRRRKLLAAAAVAVGTLAATALASVLVASGDRLAAELAGYGANLRVTPAAARPTFPVAELDRLRTIFWRNNLVAVAPLYTLRVRAAAAPADGVAPAAVRSAVVPLVGTWFDHPLEARWRTGLPGTRPTLRVDGRWPAEGADEAVVGDRAARVLGIAPGATVRVALGGVERTLRVVGRVHSGGEEDDALLAPIAVAQALAGRPGEATGAEVFALTTPEPPGPRVDPKRLDGDAYDRWYCTAYPTSVAFQVDEALPSAEAHVAEGVAAATSRVLGRLRGTLLLLVAVVGIGSALAVTAAMTAAVLERRLEVGLLAALGAERRQVSAFFLSEAAILGAAGGLAGGLGGLAAGRAVGAAVFGVAVPWMPVLLAPAVALGVVLGLAGSLVPVARALRRHPAFLLREVPA